MSTRYIFNPDNFDGTCLTTIDINTGKIAYTQLNWDEYNAAHGGNLQALEWDDFYYNWIKPHELKLQGEWIECAEADYDDMSTFCRRSSIGKLTALRLSLSAKLRVGHYTKCMFAKMANTGRLCGMLHDRPTT